MKPCDDDFGSVSHTMLSGAVTEQERLHRGGVGRGREQGHGRRGRRVSFGAEAVTREAVPHRRKRAVSAGLQQRGRVSPLVPIGVSVWPGNTSRP